MDRTYRKDLLATVHHKGREISVLADQDREYSLAARHHHACWTGQYPRREAQGSLCPGVNADITIYTPNENKETMFELPRLVIKAGHVIVVQGETREDTYGKTLHVEPDHDRDVEPDISRWFEASYSIQWRKYPVDSSYLHDHEVVT
jgi:formylmethanofuran dehydrogenase subunit A